MSDHTPHGTYGASALFAELYKKFGFTVAAAKEAMGR